MANRQIRVYQRRPPSKPTFFVAPYRRGKRPCRRCDDVDRYLSVDLLHISGYAETDSWSTYMARSRLSHRGHVGEAMAEAEARTGELGAAYVKTFRDALDAVSWVVEAAKKDGNLEVILTAAKVSAEIGEMQAKIADAIPLRGRGRPTKEQIAEGTKPDVRDEDFDAVIEDYQATKG